MYRYYTYWNGLAVEICKGKEEEGQGVWFQGDAADEVLFNLKHTNDSWVDQDVLELFYEGKNTKEEK